MRFTFVIAYLVAVPFFAFAENPSADATRVIGVLSESASEAPSAFITVIKPSEDKSSRSLPEVLSQTAGMHTTELGGLGQLSTISIRGSSHDQVGVFLDGVPLNGSQTAGVDMSTIPLGNIERIEIIRGGNSAAFGSQSIGGAINLVTKPMTSKRAWDVRLTGGSFGTFKSGISWNEPLKRLDLLVTHDHFSSQGDYPFRSASTNLLGTTVGGGRNFTRLHNASLSEGFLTKATFRFSASMKATASNDFFWSDRDIPGTEEETTLLYPSNPLEAKETILRDTTSFVFTWKDPLPQVSWETGVSNRIGVSAFSDPSPSLGQAIDVTYMSDGIHAHTAGTHHAKVDATSFMTILRSEVTFDLSDDSSPLTGAPLQGTHIRHTPAVLLSEEMGLFDDKITLIPTLRVEDASDRPSRFIWKLGAILRPLASLEVRGNLGTSHRYPAFDELYFPDQGYLRGNPNLDDESAFGGDIGFILTGDRARFETTYFEQAIDNSILFVPISSTTIQPVNTARAHSRGIELALRVSPWDWLDLETNYTWQRMQFSGTNLALPGRPEHKLNARVEGQYRPASLYAELQFVDRYPVNLANTVVLTSRTTANVGMTVKFKQRYFASCDVKDLADVQTYDARGFPLPRRSFWITVGARS